MGAFYTGVGGGTATGESGIARGEIWVAVHDPPLFRAPCPFVGVEMYLQITRMNGKHREERVNAELGETQKKSLPGRAVCRSPATLESGPCRTSAQIQDHGR